jgi:2-methylcitrate dehydratase
MFVEKDGHLAVSGHRSDNIPVALAVGERLSSTVRDVLDAIALNYELYGRLRAVMPEEEPWDGASVSGIVAAAMTGRLIGLDATRQAHALALAATRTAAPKIVRKGEISAAKNLANAFVAEAGLQAALLAEKGVTGPLQILDHEDGLHQVFNPKRGLDQVWATITAPPEIMSAHMKSYPSIGTSQTAVTAALAAYPKLKGRIDEIAQIDVVMADLPAVRRQQGDKARSQPRSREAADHSFAFLVVVTLLDGKLTTKQFANERWLQPSIGALMQRVNLVVDADIRDRAPGSMPCRLCIKLKDGSEIVEECLYPPGHSFADKGLDTNAVVAKFKDVTSEALSPAQQAAIVAAALDTAETGKITALTQHVRKV